MWRQGNFSPSQIKISVCIYIIFLCIPVNRIVYNTPKSIQASVTILENLHLIIEKTKPEDVTTDIMPMLFFSFDGSTIQVQVSTTRRRSFQFTWLGIDMQISQTAAGSERELEGDRGRENANGNGNGKMGWHVNWVGICLSVDCVITAENS